MTRRFFLTTLFTLGTMVTVRAQEVPKPPVEESPKPDEKPDDPNPLKLDSRGTPYKDCPACGAKCYLEEDGKTFVCESCGFSWVEG